MTNVRDRLRAELELALAEPAPAGSDLVARLTDSTGAVVDALLADAEAHRAATVERAAAVGLINGTQPAAGYLRSLADVLQRSLTIREQTDLARTVRQEGDRLAAVATNLVAVYPELRVVDEVSARVDDTRPRFLVPADRRPTV